MTGRARRGAKGEIAARKAGRALYERAYETLKDMILNVELPPGRFATEKEIAERLDMSRTPIREALLRLEYEGLIEIFPRRGVQVTPISITDTREIYHLLSALEVTAAELLAALDDEARLAASDALDAAVGQMARALENDDLDGWARADATFHQLLLDHCGNGRLKRMAYTIWNQAHRVRLITLRLRPKPSGSTKDHQDLVDAIRAGDVDAAREIHRAHRKTYMIMLMNLMENYRISHV